jgi:RimJ/RimL family protein N-acetyltransferase
MTAIAPCVLEGRWVRLEPLTVDHVAGLAAVGLDPELWRWTTSGVLSLDDMRVYVQTALDWQRQGIAVPFATVERASGTVVGSTRFAAIDRVNRRVEIGWTWVAPAWQRTPINTEAKYLMLRHAFEAWGCIRVELKTNSLNAKSRAAILRIGAKEEGTFRNHMINDDGSTRHTVYYSVIDSEWPEVKAGLEAKLIWRNTAPPPEVQE